MTFDTDAVVIGAGVVGLACARTLAAKGHGVIVLERHDRFGVETSSRNSEVIHAGIYYTPGSLKATLCGKGNRSIYAYCVQHGVPHKRLGKLIVATSAGAVSESLRDAFHASVSRYLDGLAPEDLAPDQAGIRPKLTGPGEPPRDFVVTEESARGFAGWVNLVGIESPGLTCALEIAELVGGFLEEQS